MAKPHAAEAVLTVAFSTEFSMSTIFMGHRNPAMTCLQSVTGCP